MSGEAERKLGDQSEAGLLFSVRQGEVADAGSWIYAWVAVRGDPGVVYVGATGLHPVARAWLHLHDPDPDVGRIADRLPGAASEPLDVLALRLPAHVSRRDAKAALIARLAEAKLLSEEYVGDPPAASTDLPAASAEQAELLQSWIAAHVERLRHA